LKKLFVGSLPWSVDSDQLKEIFSGYKSVTFARVVFDRETNRSRGFGFVEMSDDAEADKAVVEMNGVDIQGRAIVVNEAKPREDNR